MANFTKKAIKESFLKLLNEKPMSRITVRDIVEDCGINRNHSVNRDVFDRELLKLCSYAVTTYIDTVFPEHHLDEAERARVIRFIQCEFFGLIIEWLNSGMRSDAVEDLHHIAALCKGLPAILPEELQTT